MTSKLYYSAIVVLCFVVAGVGVQPARAQTFTTLYNFTGESDGGNPVSGVIQDQAGNFYGTAGHGGSGVGVVYKLNTAGMETVLQSFTGPSGGYPFAPLVSNKTGVLYSTTSAGGPQTC